MEMSPQIGAQRHGGRRVLPSARAHEDVCTRSEAIGPHEVKQIRLGNRQNACYANAIVTGLLHLESQLRFPTLSMRLELQVIA